MDTAKSCFQSYITSEAYQHVPRRTALYDALDKIETKLTLSEYLELESALQALCDSVEETSFVSGFLFKTAAQVLKEVGAA